MENIHLHLVNACDTMRRHENISTYYENTRICCEILAFSRRNDHYVHFHLLRKKLRSNNIIMMRKPITPKQFRPEQEYNCGARSYRGGLLARGLGYTGAPSRGLRPFRGWRSYHGVEAAQRSQGWGVCIANQHCNSWHCQCRHASLCVLGVKSQGVILVMNSSLNPQIL